MKHLALIILSICCACGLYAAEATKNLDPVLLKIFEQIKSEPQGSKLKGKEFETDLTIKIATDTFLVFSDAYLQVDAETKYQIGKWIFTPEQMNALNAKRGSVCHVKFKIEQVLVEAPYSDMPHFTAHIQSIVVSDAEVDQGGVRQ